jgi:hypothetical protein
MKDWNAQPLLLDLVGFSLILNLDVDDLVGIEEVFFVLLHILHADKPTIIRKHDRRVTDNGQQDRLDFDSVVTLKGHSAEAALGF